MLVEARMAVGCPSRSWVLQRSKSVDGGLDEKMPYKVAGGFISKSQELFAAVLHLLMVKTSAEY